MTVSPASDVLKTTDFTPLPHTLGQSGGEQPVWEVAVVTSDMWPCPGNPGAPTFLLSSPAGVWWDLSVSSLPVPAPTRGSLQFFQGVCLCLVSCKCQPGFREDKCRKEKVLVAEVGLLLWKLPGL